MNKSKGFTLPEMLISISLGLFLSVLLIKIYLWQIDLNHKMEDMIFIDHNGFLALQILKNAIKSAEEVKVENSNKLIIFRRKSKTEHGKKISITNKYFSKNNELIRESTSDNILALISGITKLTTIQNPSYIIIQLELTAPHKMTAKIQETVPYENKK
jgi:prepilin-type N-terminal cleavage/methylation domain-containing protein